MKNIHVAVGSTTSMPGAVEANLAQITGFARQAATDGAQLLLTAELSASGYGSFPEILATAEVAGQGAIYKALAACARETGVVICAGFVEKNPEFGLDHLSHYVIYPNGHFVVQRKHNVTPGEQPLARPPQVEGVEEFTVFDIAGVSCGITICADAGVVNIREKLRKRGVKLVLQPAGAGGLRADRVTDEELRTPEGRATYARILEAVFFPGQESIMESIRLGQAAAAVNVCGYDGQRYYHVGHGMIITGRGEVPGFFHGQPNLDRQRPMYAHAEIDIDDVIEGTH